MFKIPYEFIKKIILYIKNSIINIIFNKHKFAAKIQYKYNKYKKIKKHYGPPSKCYDCGEYRFINSLKEIPASEKFHLKSVCKHRCNLLLHCGHRVLYDRKETENGLITDKLYCSKCDNKFRVRQLWYGLE
jgi:hypothetical protein